MTIINQLNDPNLIRYYINNHGCRAPAGVTMLWAIVVLYVLSYYIILEFSIFNYKYEKLDSY